LYHSIGTYNCINIKIKYKLKKLYNNDTYKNNNFIPSLFHAKSITSSKVSDLDPGVIGVLILCKSQMNISDSDAPDANKFV